MLDRTGKADHVRYNRTATYAGISVQTVYNMLDEYLENQDIKVTGEVEAKIIALAYSKAPDEHSACWQKKP